MGKITKAMGILMIISYISFLVGCSNQTIPSINYYKNIDHKEKMEDASSSPYGRYPEKVVYTLGKLSNSDHAGMPEEDDFENNAYTRYLNEKLNIQNKNVFSGAGSDYSNMVRTAITSGDIPDLMVIEDYETLKLLVEEDMIEDLTPYYEQCASERLKEIYGSYGEHFFDEVTFDKKLMAFPETLIDSGPNILWLRYDWLKQLGLKEPETIQDVIAIAREFYEQDMGQTGKTIGLPMTTAISSDYIASMNILFASKGAYLRNWILKDGVYQYGSILPEAKEGLIELCQMYEEGILDQNFLFRGDQNIEQLIQEGNCGIFFGEWWSGDNPLMKAKKMNPKVDWRPYLIATDTDGKTSYVQQNPVGKYVVVRKGFEHPEIVVKMHNVLFDSLAHGDESTKEIAGYYEQNVDQTARPCSINVDYQDALKRAYKNIHGALVGKIDPEELGLLDYSYYHSCKEYLEKKEQASHVDWAAYVTRILACSLLNENKIRKIDAFLGVENIDFSENTLENLKNLENEVYLSIIIGEKPIEAFDDFVKEWKKQGGDALTKKINQQR